MTVNGKQPMRLLALVAVMGLLAGCEEGPNMAFLQPKDKAETPAETSKSTKLVERDVEAPDVFDVKEAALWDGRPSLGGVWVAHPDVTDPERVIIRNPTNGKFVIGALFRREREIPGPRIQVSSDAAQALSMLAGAPVELNVTALRREAVEETPPADEQAATTLDEADAISETALDPIAGAAAAIDASEVADGAAVQLASADPATPLVTPKPAAAAAAQPKAKPKSSSLSKPYIQIGIFSVEANANRTADQMRNAGMIPTVFSETTNGKPFWRVVVGPAQTSSERSALLGKVKETGFSDAYIVSN
ncbi:SPOR domain-containing protein [Seohaeicola saemankumensis]|nr:SPOR domain-containing protein [Seohaeicola saemankumensis]MCA0871332.1 SPOR domain-containing protein [Seohaeicola saemankumensis]